MIRNPSHHRHWRHVTPRLLQRALLTLSILVLAACSGGGGGGGGGTPFTVSTNVGSGGGISPGSASVNQGSTASFTVTPETGFSIASVTGCGGTLSGSTYTTGAIGGACTVTATFELNTYTVMASTGEGGSIAPSSAQVDHGATTAFSVTPDPGYEVDTVSGCAGSLSGQTYTTGPITADCAIEVTFIDDLTAPTGVSASGGDGFATVIWTAVPGATGYNVYWSQTPEIDRNTSASFDDIDIGVTSPHVVSGLSNGTTYYFVVTATRNSGESEISSEVSATPSAVPAGEGDLRTSRYLIDVGGARAEPLHVGAVSAFLVEGEEILFRTGGFEPQLWRHDMTAGRIEYVADAGGRAPHSRHALALSPQGEVFAFDDDGENISTTLIAIGMETGESRTLQNDDIRTYPHGDLAVTASGNLVVTSLTGAVLLMDAEGNTLADPEKPLGVYEVRALTRAPSGTIIAAAVAGVPSAGTMLLEVDPQTAALTAIGTFATVGSGLNSERHVAATAEAYYVGALGTSSQRTLHRIDKTTFDVTEIELHEDIRLETINSSLRTGDDGALYVRVEDRRALPVGHPVVVRLDPVTHEPEIALGGATSVSDASGDLGNKWGALGPDNDLLLPYFAVTGSAVPNYARILRHVRRTGALKLVTSEAIDGAVLVDPRQIAVSGNDVYVLDRRPAEYLVHVDFETGVQSVITEAPSGTTFVSLEVLDDGTIVVLGWTDLPSSPTIWVVDAAGELEEVLSRDVQIGLLLMRMR